MASSNKTASKAFSSEQNYRIRRIQSRDAQKRSAHRRRPQYAFAFVLPPTLLTQQAGICHGGPGAVPQGGWLQRQPTAVRAAAMASIQPVNAAQAMSGFGARSQVSNFASSLSAAASVAAMKNNAFSRAAGHRCYCHGCSPPADANVSSWRHRQGLEPRLELVCG